MNSTNSENGCTAGRRVYQRMDFSPVSVDLSGTILTGSLTSVPIKINEVTVEDFENGFDATAYPDGFKDITFD